jgi:uncharacterized RDD family membrane protein YckC
MRGINMRQEDPYKPPETDVADVVDAELNELATRGERLAGALVDGIIAIAVLWPAMYAVGFWKRASAGTVGAGEVLLFGAFGFVLFVVLHGYLLSKHGQTIGKRIVGTRIVSIKDSRILPLPRLLAFRYAPIWIATQVPLLGNVLGLVNVLFIFGRERRCLHDIIAGTKVIKV